ncbi:hypothetical protein F5Y17DRAFT_145449 [Xylariaceae sp. FL0594]|nr:hypothetical protein F5Y17DRAFT_145449 [Xylariaceae sp. FL0594]
MSPSPGDRASPSGESKGVGGFASVFKGLASATKLSKANPTTVQSAGPSKLHAEITEQLKSIPVSRTLPPQYTALCEQLKDGAVHERVSAATALCRVVADYPLNPVLGIWHAAKDLIEPPNNKTTRVAGWQLLAECVKHPASSDLERKDYFQTISMIRHPDEFRLQLRALGSLSNNGRDVSGFDYDIFPLLSTWLQTSFDMVRTARHTAKKQHPRSKNKTVATDEEKDFADLFAFVSNVIKFNSVLADDNAAENLVDALLKICLYTSNADDMRACIGILDNIITFGVLPGSKLRKCVQVLSSIHCLVRDVQKEAWHTLSILCRSHNGQATVRVLLGVLDNASEDRTKKKEDVREIRGGLSVLNKLISKSSEKGYPLVPYGLLVSGLSKVVETTSTWKIFLDILRLANTLFEEKQGEVNGMLVGEDWTSIFEVVSACSAGAITLWTRSSQQISSQSLQDGDQPEAMIIKELSQFVSRVEDVVRRQQEPFIQRQNCILFFAKIHPVISNSVANLVLDYFKEFRCCFPSDARWKANLDLVLDAFFKNKKRSTEVRLYALAIITEVYDMLDLITDDETEPGFVPNLVDRLLAGVAEETDIAVLQQVVSFSVTVATATNFTLFCQITDTLRCIVGASPARTGTTGSHSQSSAAKPWARQTPADVVTKGFVQIFLRVMNVDVAKSMRLFDSLVSIAKLDSETDARLTAMKLLFRIRADWADRIFITTFTETHSLATVLLRTESTTAHRPTEEAPQQTRPPKPETGSLASRPSRGVSFSQGQLPERFIPSRVASGPKAANATYQPLWIASDSDALPESPPTAASPVLYSSVLATAAADSQEALLPMGTWLDAILHLMQTGCDWEIYSFILVHLPSQLSNHAVFGSAVPQLQELRSVVCSDLKNPIAEPPAATGVRRSDVVVCLMNMLTIILSYHRHFTKADEDDIVRTFLHGLNSWERSSKTCIHALQICCHELPSSIAKQLEPILQRMAQVITQPIVPMPILEFLAGLSRLPALYKNFRKENYQTVFGICVRYLQFVRGKKTAHRPSSTGDAIGDDLPQYVYTLAYHVIIFWFLALKLTDRASHVSFIAKKLFTDVDGSQVTDEQAQTAIDFMQRVTYADVDESAADPFFTPDRFGEIVKKNWLIGNSIVTVEQAVASGWAQITKRQPSGTSSYAICELFRPPPAHQETMGDSTRDAGTATSTNTVLPSHILVQLLSSMPQQSDMSRPIPLPDNEAVDLAIRVFDRSSTVDGHKVGVIYIGENQTDEAEILANVSGSSDYVEFLNGLGTLTKLKGATFNTQGLDRQYDTDGEYAFCWRDRVTELVFHVTTQMPTNLEHDPHCTLKKRHIGNDFVNIIFNDSGFPFRFDTFPSDFNYVNIVITPESRASFVATRQRTPKDVENSFYKVQVMSKPGFPEISSAAETKIISLKALPDYIRLLALNASFFSHVWANRDGVEQLSSWGGRLRAINQLREKYGPKMAPPGPTPSPPSTASSHANKAAAFDVSRPSSTVRESFGPLNLRRPSVPFFGNSSDQNPHSHRSSVQSTETSEATPTTAPDALIESLDFSKWA